MHTGPIPVAIFAGDATQNDREHRQLLHDMAGSIGFAVEAVLKEWTAAHDDSGIAGYVLDQLIREDGAPETRAQWVSGVTIDDRGVVHATMNVHFERFTEMGDGDSPVIRAEFANWIEVLLVESGISPARAERVSAAMLAAPPTMTLNVAETQTRRNNLGAAVEVDDAFVSTANRMIAERVKAAGVVPKLYDGDEAKALDRDVLAAIALDLLEERLSEYSSDKLVAFGMEQLNSPAAVDKDVLDRVVFLDMIAVRPTQRRKGLASKMLGEVEEQLRARRATVLFGNVTDGDAAELSDFYRSAGFTVLSDGQALPPFLGLEWTMPNDPAPRFWFYKKLGVRAAA